MRQGRSVNQEQGRKLRGKPRLLLSSPHQLEGYNHIDIKTRRFCNLHLSVSTLPPVSSPSNQENRRQKYSEISDVDDTLETKKSDP